MARIGVHIRYRRPWLLPLARHVVRLPFCERIGVWLAVRGAGLEIHLRGEWQSIRCQVYTDAP